MQRMKSWIGMTVLVGVILSASVAEASVNAAVLFLRIAAGARAAGMGETFVAISDDATATHWNPAGLGDMPRAEVTWMHANWLPSLASDIYYEFIAGVVPVKGWGNLGASVTFLSYGEILRTDERGRPGNSFHSFDGAFSLSYGTKLGNSLAAGLSAKVIYSRLSDQGAGAEIGTGSATAFALDAGVLYHTPLKPLTLGAAVTNIGPNISYIDAQQSDPLPRNLAIGVSYKLLESEYNRLTLAAEINKALVSLDNSAGLKQIVYNAGGEYWYASVIALRAGYIYDQDGQIKTPTVGAGLAFRNLQLDFAYIPSTKDTPLANTLRISMTGKF